MTPFDADALLAMLLAFYPVVSSSELARARRERPEYFAGGALIGSKGDKLQLPDGRVFDLILAAGGAPGQQRWQVIVPAPGDVAGDGAFTLEPGPIVPLDESAVLVPRDTPTFEGLIGDALGTIGDADTVLGSARTAVAEADPSAALEASFAQTIEPAATAHAATIAALDGDDLGDILDATNGQDGAINAADSDYDETPPADLPDVDPGDPPPSPGDRELPPPV